MFALLGDQAFHLVTWWSALSGQEGVDYAEHGLIEGKPRLQWIGDKLDVLTLTVTLRIDFCDPAAELDRLRQVMKSRQAQPLVFGNGVFRGRFVVTDLRTRTERTTATGALLAIDADITLREHVAPPEPATFASPAATKGPAAKTTSKPVAKAITTETVTNPDGFSARKIVRAP